jgi:hypothetical protein
LGTQRPAPQGYRNEFWLILPAPEQPERLMDPYCGLSKCVDVPGRMCQDLYVRRLEGVYDL